MLKYTLFRGHSSSGRAPPCQGGGSEFEPRCPLQSETGHPIWMSCFLLERENSLPPPTREARFESEVRQGSLESPETVRGMPGSEFEPRCPLQSETGHPVWMSCFLLEREDSLHPPTREARFESEVRQGSLESPEAVRGMPGSEFEPRCPLRRAD